MWGGVARPGVLTHPRHQRSPHGSPSVLLCWWPRGFFEASADLETGPGKVPLQGCSPPPATLWGALLHAGLFLAPKKETSRPKRL